MKHLQLLLAAGKGTWPSSDVNICTEDIEISQINPALGLSNRNSTAKDVTSQSKKTGR